MGSDIGQVKTDILEAKLGGYTMLKKTFRQLNDGLSTVRIDLDLPLARLKDLQDKADFDEISVDMVISHAINEYLVQSQLSRKNGFVHTMTELHQIVDNLKKENSTLKTQIHTIGT